MLVSHIEEKNHNHITYILSFLKKYFSYTIQCKPSFREAAEKEEQERNEGWSALLEAAPGPRGSCVTGLDDAILPAGCVALFLSSRRRLMQSDCSQKA